MNKVYSLVLDTFKKGIDGEKGVLPELHDDEKEQFLKIIKEQSLNVFLYKVYGLKDYKKTYLSSKIFENYAFNLKNEITSILEENNIQFYFVKGIDLKNIYKDSALRTMGDIDFVVFKKDFDKVHQLLIDHGFNDKEDIASNHIGLTKNNILIELHFNLVPYNSYCASYFDEENVKKHLDLKNHTLEANYYFGFLLVHYIKHLLSGEGIRGLADFYLLLKGGYVNKNKVLKVVSDLKLNEFFNKILNLLYIIFGYKEFDFEPVDNDEELISYVLSCGTHGKSEDFSSIDYSFKSSGKGRFRFILSRVFPDIDSMKLYYQMLNKYIILLPLCYIHRCFKLVFSKKSREKARKVVEDKSNAKSIYDMFSIDKDFGEINTFE